MGIIQTPGLLKETVGFGLRDPFKFTHFDITDASDRISEPFNDIAQWKLIGELSQIYDTIVIGQANTI